MSNTTKIALLVFGAALVGGVGYILMDSGAEPAGATPQPVLTGERGMPDGGSADGQEVAGPEVLVYKTATCGCCGNWVEYMRREGFTVRAEDVTDLTAVKVEYGVPPELQSCHTAIVGGYVIEGHVPAESIRRLLDERPEVAGLAVAGMPTGSPGMEMPGQDADPYDVLAFDAAGTTTVYESR